MEYAKYVFDYIWVINAVMEATPCVIMILSPGSVFNRLKTQPAGAAMARFYGLVMIMFSLISLLFLRGVCITLCMACSVSSHPNPFAVPDNDTGKIIFATAWLLFHAFGAICFTVPVLGRVGDGTTGAGFGHAIFSALWAYYLFVHHNHLPVLKELVKF